MILDVNLDRATVTTVVAYTGMYSGMSFSIGLVVPEPYQYLSLGPTNSSIGRSTHQNHNA